MIFSTATIGTVSPAIRMTIKNNGKVGIGTTAPSNILSINTANAGDGISLNGVMTIGNTVNVSVKTNLGSGSYNGITQAGDSGIIYTGTTIGNAKGFVIAPWAAATSGIRIDGSGNVGIGTTVPGYLLDVSGTVRASSYLFSSDRKLKKNISKINNPIKKILALNGVSFEWKKQPEKQLGFIAQDVEKVFPEVVSTDPNSGLKSVQYANLIAPIVEAVKEQQMLIQAQAIQIEKLKKELEELKEERN
jgi:hypothetical protein